MLEIFNIIFTQNNDDGIFLTRKHRKRVSSNWIVSGLVINEIMQVSNVSEVIDQSGEYDDWVELYWWECSNKFKWILSI